MTNEFIIIVTTNIVAWLKFGCSKSTESERGKHCNSNYNRVENHDKFWSRHSDRPDNVLEDAAVVENIEQHKGEPLVILETKKAEHLQADMVA